MASRYIKKIPVCVYDIFLLQRTLFIDTQIKCLVLVRSSFPWTLLCGVLYDRLLGMGRRNLKLVRMSNLLFSLPVFKLAVLKGKKLSLPA